MVQFGGGLRMEDGVFSTQDAMLATPPEISMDFDFMDELLLGGCWLETTDGSELLNHSPSNSTPLFDSSLYLWSIAETNANVEASEVVAGSTQVERDGSIVPQNQNKPVNEPRGDNLVTDYLVAQNTIDLTGEDSAHLESCLVEGGSELSRRWWIGPRANPGPSSSVMERLIQALGYIKDSTYKDALIQLWVPINRGGKCVLTTVDQPYSLNPSCLRLARYRDISVNYHFTAEKDSNTSPGLPGRVFLGKVPEWSPDVRFFRSDEYARVHHARRCDVRGTLALPVFEQGSRTCLGVIEVVMITQKVNYKAELESVCKALQAVDLRSSEIFTTQGVELKNKSFQIALPEILEVLRSACETHKLPLAQTWVPCNQQGKGGSRHSDENYAHCVSTEDSACYVADPCMQSFHEACSEHHLLKGQGLAGAAFMTNQPCFSADITSISKTEYPLSHHARVFGLHAAVAIRLRSIQTGSTDFVLEFFLPPDCKDPEEHKKMLSSLSVIIQRVCCTLRVVTDEELEEEVPVLVGKVPSNDRSYKDHMKLVEHSHSEASVQNESSWSSCLPDVQQSATIVPLLQKEKPSEVLLEKSCEFRQHQQDSGPTRAVDLVGNDSVFVGGSFSSERKRMKAEKAITLQVLRQYFSGSLNDAAKRIGVCPTTLKRICRQHGIKRWPSRKIKKVGHSLQKLQVVIDSVQGASGSLKIDSFYSNFPELAPPKSSETGPFSTSKMDHPKKPSSTQSGARALSPLPAVSKSASSSCSQSSSSSHSCSSGSQCPFTPNTMSSGDPIVAEDFTDGVLKWVKSDAELHTPSKDGANLLPRAQSHNSLKEHPSIENISPSQKNDDQLFQEQSGWRVKVTHGEEKIRFRLQKQRRYEDLRREILRRFNVDDTGMVTLKYLDDDSEWVLLTCDADLEECMDINRSSECPTIKLSLQVVQQNHGNSSGSSGMDWEMTQLGGPTVARMAKPQVMNVEGNVPQYQASKPMLTSNKIHLELP
ncbi:PB1 domain [Dillenia turbinata]|uniref:PB1 domain n=1 Tax=Dillenia turbinata TaxID=194707 RepID=A0AAN8VRY3_9MAGN